MPPVESSAYGTPVTEFFLYKKGWYEHDGKPDLHLGGWSKHAFKGHCFVCELKNIRTCMHSTTPRLWAVPPWHCHHVPHKTKTDIVLYSCKTKQAGHAGTTLLKFKYIFMHKEKEKSKCFVYGGLCSRVDARL